MDSVTGIGVCLVSVDPASGRVTTASMEQSTGDSTLDKSAVNAFRKWRFQPGTVSKGRIPIEFNMTGASHYLRRRISLIGHPASEHVSGVRATIGGSINVSGLLTIKRVLKWQRGNAFLASKRGFEFLI